MPAGRVNGNRFQQIPQLCRAGRVKATVRPAGQSGDLSKCHFGDGLGAFLEQEHRNAHDPELAGNATQIVNVFFHAVADEHQGTHSAACSFRKRVTKHFLNLGVAAQTGDAGHAPDQIS